MSELLKINVNGHTEKKNGLTYLSWAWAWAEVLKLDPAATWVAHTYGQPGAEEPCMRVGKTAMVHVSATIKGLRRECMLPVMDHRNKAIPDPDAFAVNTAIMRCLAKAIAMHGLGLYIYAGEDLPEQGEAEPVVTKPAAGAVKKDRSLVHKPTDGAADGFTEEQLQNLQEIAMYLIDCHKSGKDLEAIRFCNEPSNFAHSDEKVYVWDQLAAYPTLRSAIKANKTEAVAA